MLGIPLMLAFFLVDAVARRHVVSYCLNSDCTHTFQLWVPEFMAVDKLHSPTSYSVLMMMNGVGYFSPCIHHTKI